MKTKIFVGMGVVAVVGLFWLLYLMLFPPTMDWQEFRMTPVADLGFTAKNIPWEKADKVFDYRVVLLDVPQFSPGEYLGEYGDDVAIKNIIFTKDKERVISFLKKKGVNLVVKKSLYHPKARYKGR